MLVYPSDYNARQIIVLPAVKFGATPSDQNFHIRMTGIAKIDDAKASTDGSWQEYEVQMHKSNMYYDHILERVADSLPPLPTEQHTYEFMPVQFAVQVSLNTIINTGKWEASGYGVNSFYLWRADNGSGHFLGITTDLKVRDKDGAALLQRVSYDIEMYGYFKPLLIESED
ncbi:MAG TPA: hypothetical protein PKA00_15680 [Saprospiraceae bacterium]|nr:hypothetical protein [Saprospiraceae bacterium]HMQ84354.1 hypothetical protein [Saprospiraceae bacterium]